MTFVPDAARGVAQVDVEPPLAGVQADATRAARRPATAATGAAR